MFRGGSVRSEWASARPPAFPEEGDAQGEQLALARGIIHKWFEANHWVAIDGVAVELGLAARRYTVSHSWGRGGGKTVGGWSCTAPALHCQPQSRTWREKTLNNEAALRVVAYAIRR
jgi:hypothetical protein